MYTNEKPCKYFHIYSGSHIARTIALIPPRCVNGEIKMWQKKWRKKESSRKKQPELTEKKICREKCFCLHASKMCRSER